MPIFLANGKTWESANRTIVEARRRLHQESLPAIANLAAAVKHEIEYQTFLWRGDYELEQDAVLILSIRHQRESGFAH